MENVKKFISVMLIALILYTCIPVTVYATDNYETNEDVSYSASNALGGVLVDAMNTSDEELENNKGYGVFGVVFNGDSIDVSFAAPDYSTVVAAVYEEDTNKMVTSGMEYVNSDDNAVTISFADYDLPEHFIIKVFILDYNNAPVCEVYENKEHTKAFEEFFAKTVFDFKEENVISLNNDTETNFAVVSDDVTVLEIKENENIVVTDDYANGIYVIRNADNQLKSLKRGDCFYYAYGENGEYILTKIGSIKTEGNLTTISADSTCEINDLFSYIDIDTSKEPSTATFDFDEDSGEDDFDKLYKLVSGEKVYEDENGYLKFSVAADVRLHMSFYYDFELFGTDKYEFEFWVSVLAHADVEANLKTSIEKKFELLDKSIPVLSGLDLVVKLEATITFDASITAKGEIVFTMKNGAKATHKGSKEIKEKPVILLNIEVDGNYELHFIPELTVGVNLLKVIHADMSVPVDFSTEGKLYVTTPEEKDKHSCAICIDGTIDANVKLKIVVKFGVDQESAKKIVDIKPVNANFHWGDYYISISDTGKLKFGFGECANTSVWTQSCGKFLTATLFNDGELVISGVGDMYSDYTYSLTNSQIMLPWWTAYSDDIKIVTIEEGVTNICDGAFVSCENLTTATIPLSVVKIGKFAFAFCDNFKTICYGGTYEQWGNIKIGTLAGLSKVTIVYSQLYSLRKSAVDNTINYSDEDEAIYALRNVSDATVTSPIIGNNYVIIVVKDSMAEDIFSNDNLIYIDQKIAETDELTFDFESDESITDYEIIYTNAFLHKHGYIGKYTNPSCSEAGFITYSCTCGDSYIESIDAYGHAYNSVVTEPTCTKKGFTTYTCDCGDTYVDDYVKEKGHSYKPTITLPTCTAQGYTTYTCACSDSYTADYVAAKGHSYTAEITKTATCTEPGTKTYTCTCGDTYTEEIAATGHDFDGSECKNCDFDKAADCSCNCHAGGIKAFFFKLINFFRKLFDKSAKVCACGAAH